LDALSAQKKNRAENYLEGKHKAVFENVLDRSQVGEAFVKKRFAMTSWLARSVIKKLLAQIQTLASPQ
jgi:hypothetical protein